MGTVKTILPKWIVGKTVSRVDLNPFDDGKGGTAHNPRIWFTDGSSIGFYTQETETGEYGQGIGYTPARRKQ